MWFEEPFRFNKTNPGRGMSKPMALCGHTTTGGQLVYKQVSKKKRKVLTKHTTTRGKTKRTVCSLPVIGPVVAVLASGLVLPLTAVRISPAAFPVVHPLLPAVLILPQAGRARAHSLGLPHLKRQVCTVIFKAVNTDFL